MLVERLGRVVMSASDVQAGTCVAFCFSDTTYFGIRTDWPEQGGSIHEMVASIYPADPDLNNMPGLLHASVFAGGSLYVLPDVQVSLPLLLPEFRVEPASFQRTPGSIFLAENDELILVVRYQNRNVMLNVQSGSIVQGKRPAVWFSRWELVHRSGDQRQVICTVAPAGGRS